MIADLLLNEYAVKCPSAPPVILDTGFAGGADMKPRLSPTTFLNVL